MPVVSSTESIATGERNVVVTTRYEVVGVYHKHGCQTHCLISMALAEDRPRLRTWLKMTPVLAPPRLNWPAELMGRTGYFLDLSISEVDGRCISDVQEYLSLKPAFQSLN